MKPMTEQHLAILRRHMVDVVGIQADLMTEELGRGQLDARVLEAMLRVPRHRFVPAELAALAYHDTPLPIGFDKTISQPFICALMLDLLAIEEGESVLEVGTGLGYLSAIMAELGAQVWSVEIVEEFAEEALQRLSACGYDNVTVRIGDGSRGWIEHAPFDKIVVSAAARQPPEALLNQLKAGGRMVAPIGPTDVQQLTVIDKAAGGEVRTREVIPVRFSQLEM
ncbi:MAG: protein-L-isoaspartate(D-aspartate) O-methyltransferase [Sphingorhabdus sp.]